MVSFWCQGAVKQRAELVGQLAMGCGASVPAGGKYLCRILLLGELQDKFFSWKASICK